MLALRLIASSRLSHHIQLIVFLRMLSINKANFLVKFLLDLLDTYLFDTHCVVGTGLVRQCVCVCALV